MIFLGTAFCGDGNSLFPPAILKQELLSIQIFDGTYNQIYLSTDINMTVANLDDEWNYNTKMNAKFDGSFDAGNSGFSLRNTDHIVIRRRELGTLEWTTIFTREINNVEDFAIHITDTYARSGVEYEYSVSSFVNGMENSYIIENVYSEFDGYYITDKDCLYGTVYNVDGCDTSRNISSQAVQMLNSKYMKVVSNSSLNCDTGSITGAFIKLDEAKEVDREGGNKYRNSVKDRLANKKPLILKVDDGRIWMIKPSGTISEAMDGHRDLRNITFEWTEIGDVNDMRSLYLNGFSDVDSQWW